MIPKGFVSSAFAGGAKEAAATSNASVAVLPGTKMEFENRFTLHMSEPCLEGGSSNSGWQYTESRPHDGNDGSGHLNFIAVSRELL